MQILYHIHRNEEQSIIWRADLSFFIDANFNSNFYLKLKEEEKELIRRYGNYDIDYIIAMMMEIKYKGLVNKDMINKFDELLSNYLILRREHALEEGRKLYSPSSPSRIHSIYLTDMRDLPYWVSRVGNDNYDIYELDLDGNMFVSSDIYFPDDELMFDRQVEESIKYWKPKIDGYTPHKEYIFQGHAKVLKKN